MKQPRPGLLATADADTSFVVVRHLVGDSTSPARRGERACGQTAGLPENWLAAGPERKSAPTRPGRGLPSGSVLLSGRHRGQNSIVAAICWERHHLVVEMGSRNRSILWWRVAAAYGWAIATRELAASSRWSPRTKAKAGVLVGVAISFPVTFGIGLPYVYWVLTGKGPWKRYGFSSAVVVNPFSRRIPAELRAALAELQKEWAGETRPVTSRARA